MLARNFRHILSKALVNNNLIQNYKLSHHFSKGHPMVWGHQQVQFWTMTMCSFLEFFQKSTILTVNNIPALVQIMAWHRPGDKPLSEPMMVRLPTHICVTRPQWVKMGISLKTTESWDCHIFILGFPILVRQSYTDMSPDSSNVSFIYNGENQCISMPHWQIYWLHLSALRLTDTLTGIMWMHIYYSWQHFLT